VTYEVEESFIHFDTQEVMYRVKIIYDSGGIRYTVLNEDQLKNIKDLNL
jgi:hypothetical protein